MSKELQTRQSSELDSVMHLEDAELFTEIELDRALTLLTAASEPLVADVNSDDGRREINRVARAVGGAITRLDERRRAYVAVLKAQPKAIDDLFRINFRQPAEALKDRVRAPLTEWEEEVRAADEETTRIIGTLNASIEQGTAAALIRLRLDEARNLVLPDWLSTSQRGEIVAAMDRAIPRLQNAWTAATAAENQAAEFARLQFVAREAELQLARAQAAEQATRDAEARAARAQVERDAAAAAQQQARDVQIRQEAAHAARAAALAEFEQRRTQPNALDNVSSASATQQSDRVAVHRAILAELEVHGIPTDTAKRLIVAIGKGQIPHLAITY